MINDLIEGISEEDLGFNITTQNFEDFKKNQMVITYDKKIVDDNANIQ